MVRGYDWVGNYYPKKQFEIQYDSGDDNEQLVNGIVLPPFTIPQRYWYSWSAVSNNDKTPVQHAWSVLSGRYFNIPFSLATNDDTAMNGDTLMNEHGPSSIGEWGDDDPDATESDIPGHAAMDDAASKSEFLHREKFHRLGDGQSVLTGEGDVRYCWYGTSQGKVVNKGNYCDIKDAKMMAIGYRMDQNDSSTDWSDVLSGNAADFNQLIDLLYEKLDQDNPMTLGHSGTNSIVENWLKLGYDATNTSSEAQMHITSKLTIEVGVYKPKSTRYYSAG